MRRPPFGSGGGRAAVRIGEARRVTVGRMLRDALDETLALLVPVECAGCGADGWTLCPACRVAVLPRPRRHDIGGATVWSGLAFDGVAARAMRALKGEGRTALAAELAPALLAAVACVDEPEAVLVPVPTSRAALRRRGYRVTELLARRAGLGIRRMLVPARRTRDQRLLDAQSRAGNVAGSLRAQGVTGLRVVVVDDVMTTGATLREAQRALEQAGAEVVGAAVALATPRRRRSGGPHGFPT